MADREKVAKGLECLTQMTSCVGCPYWDSGRTREECLSHIGKDAIELLKEQHKIIDRYHQADAFLEAHGWKWKDGKQGMDEKDLIGKMIEKIDVDGYGVNIRFTDGTEFVYSASDGGYSSWDISKDGEHDG